MGLLFGRIERITCLAFYLLIKMWENIYKNSYQNWQTAVKTLKKSLTCSKRNIQKVAIIVLWIIVSNIATQVFK